MTSSELTALPGGALDGLGSRVGAVLRGDHLGQGLRVAVACALFNGGITWRLLEGALDGLADCGVDRLDVKVAWVPGAFELPLVARALADGMADAVIALGAVIRGDTGHYDFVAGECAAGLQRVQLDSGRPVVFGVLTTDTVDQALVRSLPDESNKGREAAMTAVEMARLLRSAMI
ncbi:MAG TPA: 6,7-dimethyl-8-ribityllumazine synthase [Acidimicrobiales bacterium]|nr:6,7-dimethyl-8-ribityllumazine synthase [Acidimicrobiales bacterium]